MNVEIQVDREALRRNRRGMIIGGLAILLYVPVVLVAVAGVSALLGREVAGRSEASVSLAALGVLAAILFWGVRDQFVYRCPRCSRRLAKVVPQDQPEPNIHYHCPDCRVVWDLGWAPAAGGGVGA